MKPTRNPPPFLGGQGRSSREIREHAVYSFWAALMCIAALAAIGVAYFYATKGGQ